MRTLGKYRVLFATIFLACLPAAAVAQQLDLGELAKRPGFTVTKKTVNGEEVVEIRKETVVIEMSSSGTIGWDSSGMAVMCMWNIYVGAKLAADYCYPDSEAELKEDLSDAVEKLKDFIVANSLTPVTKASLDAYVQDKFKRSVMNAPRPPDAERCRNFLSDYKASGRETLRAEVAKMLAVPRPPVNSPCI